MKQEKPKTIKFDGGGIKSPKQVLDMSNDVGFLKDAHTEETVLVYSITSQKVINDAIQGYDVPDYIPTKFNEQFATYNGNLYFYILTNPTPAPPVAPGHWYKIANV